MFFIIGIVIDLLGRQKIESWENGYKKYKL